MTLDNVKSMMEELMERHKQVGGGREKLEGGRGYRVGVWRRERSRRRKRRSKREA